MFAAMLDDFECEIDSRMSRLSLRPQDFTDSLRFTQVMIGKRSESNRSLIMVAAGYVRPATGFLVLLVHSSVLHTF